VKKDTRNKFHFIKKGADVESSFTSIAMDNLSADFGGTADSYGEKQDAFIERAIAKYDRDIEIERKREQGRGDKGLGND
jgi:hypothetical protein